MKKVILGLSGVLIAAFVIIMVANAESSKQDVKKQAATTTEKTMNCAKCPSASACPMMSAAKASEGKTCDPAKCKAAGCDPAKCKEGKCDPATCKAGCAMADGKKCDPAACKHNIK